jgi:hypothetical protein
MGWDYALAGRRQGRPREIHRSGRGGCEFQLDHLGGRRGAVTHSNRCLIARYVEESGMQTNVAGWKAGRHLRYDWCDWIGGTLDTRFYDSVVYWHFAVLVAQVSDNYALIHNTQPTCKRLLRRRSCLDKVATAPFEQIELVTRGQLLPTCLPVHLDLCRSCSRQEKTLTTRSVNHWLGPSKSDGTLKWKSDHFFFCERWNDTDDSCSVTTNVSVLLPVCYRVTR